MTIFALAMASTVLIGCGTGARSAADAGNVSKAVSAGPPLVSAPTSIGLHEPTGLFALRLRRATARPELRFVFGVGGDEVPVIGDWDGDGFDSVGVYRPNESTFHLRFVPGEGEADLRVAFGEPKLAPLPLVGDWDGDGVDSPGLYSPADSSFHLTSGLASRPAEHTFFFGPAEPN